MKLSALSRVIGLAVLASTSMGANCVGAGGTDTSSTTPTPTSTPTGGSGTTSVGTVSNDGFYVTLVPIDGVTTYLHNASSFNSKCQVDVGATGSTATDITCILDIAELDLYFNSLVLNYNAPVGMCHYVNGWLYHFWKYPVDTPQTAITVCKDATTSAVLQSSPSGYVDADGNPTCPYDYSGSGGPNCCEGTFTLTSQTSSTGAAGCSGGTTSNGSFGGKISACLAGPAMDSQAKNKEGFPKPDLYFTEFTGANGSYTLASPISRELESVVHTANYYSSTDFSGNKPGPFRTFGNYSPNNYYEFDCLDQAYEYTARIRLQIRSWDTVANFTAESNPYSTGSDPIFNNPYHEFSVWKDYAAFLPTLVYPGTDE